MTNQEFDALTKLLRMRSGTVLTCTRLHFVDGLPVADAAREAGIDYRLGWEACKRVEAGLELAKIAVGNK